VGRLPLRSRAAATATAAVAVLTGAATAAFAVQGLDGGPVQPAVTVVPEAPPLPQPSAVPLGQEEREQAVQGMREAVAAATSTTQAEAAQAEQTPAAPSGEAAGQSGQCEASMYSEPQPTASGEVFDPTALTAAHKTLPFNTMVEVTNVANGRSVTVRINDRGPYVEGRCLDLSTAAFSAIASPSQGVVQVAWRVVG